ncbi:hypothetical protein GCM10022222_44650 [Amycolatopsis ultiminotia]|uniref:Uncharacterized protein n=1 Tax=Amycolatopsis ultiminotia TaxID=543629 RepID=A0ABP6WSN5_9PSEU
MSVTLAEPLHGLREPGFGESAELVVEGGAEIVGESCHDHRFSHVRFVPGGPPDLLVSPRGKKFGGDVDPDGVRSTQG